MLRLSHLMEDGIPEQNQKMQGMAKELIMVKYLNSIGVVEFLLNHMNILFQQKIQPVLGK
ncbi:MAG: hypothetical protein IPO45_00730 [Saprospiraceae bacterium]|jgi:hypothetical protein|uniref:hypothetical protein n=1 Tax=Candidatus Brachybacter algidus TaxID=2982024 RepID=UPI001B421C2C|nr:hypothetical protein [Candidatus Brachybacter algidus]MBP7307069.1 hypothetical protein [Saprospiraceae bacterium]MBK6449591.1 hypothetical protein [Candidatus Brachybacter algidus]MBK8603984.1 hypothetical protein [Candidatus Brachybacter algidus]MBK9022950.1 hypothetical protein [Candidatus Brachybacter algidus]MBK9550716.1 hypothetical protein [Candidatus Brachybacter algidus]